MRAYQVDFNPVQGRKGEVKRVSSGAIIVSLLPQKLIASDDSNGHGTLIRQIYINGRPEWPEKVDSWWVRLFNWIRGRNSRTVVGIPTACFAPNAVGNGLYMTACEAGKEIEIEVEFLADNKWCGAIFGKKAQEGT